MAARERPPFVRNVSELAWRSRGQGRFGYAGKDLGRAVGSRAFGLTMYRIDPGHVDVPTHWHLAEEEGFLGLWGAPRLVQTDFSGKLVSEDVLHPGHLAVFPADRRLGHHLEVPADAGHPAVVLVFGERAKVDVSHYPPRDVWLLRHGSEGCVAAREDGLGLFRPEPVAYYDGLDGAVGEPPAEDGTPHEDELPARYGERASDAVAPVPVVDLAKVEPRVFGEGPYARACTQLGAAAGARAFDVNHDEIPPGHVDSPFHFHLGDEEMFYVLDGSAVLRLGGPGWEGDEAEFPVGEGDCVSFPAGMGIAHQFRVPDDSEGPLRMLTFADRATVDVVRLVDSEKWIIKRLGVDRDLARAMGMGVWKGGEQTKWLDGEPLLAPKKATR